VLNISDGIGAVMFPFRFGAWPEVNVITLKRKE
jgi:predicted MPP superfamily phosphohydrolase